MAFFDEHTIFAAGGRGGDGVVRWCREKFKPKGGPNGGDGGKGGDFYVEAIRDITALRNVVRKEIYKAGDGHPGAKNSMHGANGEDFVLQLPVGSHITNKETGATFELITEGERIRLLKGGVGGFGNEHFKSSINQTPMQATKGKEGEEGTFHIELKLIADVGLVGLPNAGKTSLLNALTNTDARVAEYPFTTLDPNLGVYHKYVLADIPGLIEGASEGKGLGYKFLRHITRTSVIIHCISLERDSILKDYDVIRKELSSYPEILEKKEYIVLTKSDTVENDVAQKIKKDLEEKLGKEILCIVSIIDDQSIKLFGDSLIRILRTTQE